MSEPLLSYADQPRLVSIDEIVDIKRRRPAATSRARGWNNVTVDLYPPLANCAASYPPLDHHLISYCSKGSARLIQKRNGVVHSGTMSAGMSLLMPEGCESTWEGATASTARLRVPSSLVVCASEQVGLRCIPRVELRNVFETRDTTIAQIAQLLIAELDREAHPAQTLIVDQLSLALAAHLLRSYNTLECVAPRDVPTLSKVELSRITSYVHDNLHTSISLSELADLVHISRFHFARLFKQSTGTTAIRFVEQCRIQRAQALIAETNLSLCEIALMTGYADQSHFTRRFHREVGCTPAIFARDQGRRRAAKE